MGIGYRKRINLGGVARVNISKSGIGGSVGPKGARAGITSKGQFYARGGKGGVYFRETIPSQKGAASPSNDMPPQFRSLLKILNAKIKKMNCTREEVASYALQLTQVVNEADSASEKLREHCPEGLETSIAKKFFEMVELVRPTLVNFVHQNEESLSVREVKKSLDFVNFCIEQEGSQLRSQFEEVLLATIKQVDAFENLWYLSGEGLKIFGDLLLGSYVALSEG